MQVPTGGGHGLHRVLIGLVDALLPTDFITAPAIRQGGGGPRDVDIFPCPARSFWCLSSSTGLAAAAGTRGLFAPDS